ncbi:uncharacterized protein ATNIH1004_004506 [Aspergillus tanneri]|uniref:Microbial-type PARG catalytic domain-containing protein n=1 Tax=Aspergillus tanneri TaxID=1220188 RepID=A0A5M9MNK6_9EURO|nr:uncharacterized protein ATNIH1004_004506 [Aspergillus tanneri]KAA8648621.1 hypothetical protein ATNIH1004_004506 [Aspergillus tanneri]
MSAAVNSKSTGRKDALRLIAAETQSLLPGVLALKPQAPANAHYYPHARMPALEPRHNNPRLTTKVEVLSGDTFDVALSLESTPCVSNSTQAVHVCVLNMASEKHAGGGWLNGALAQEEELCYRSSLSSTLKKSYYPIGKRDAIYSPSVVVFRENINNGHRVMDLSKPELLPVVSVISVAAVRRPQLKKGAALPRYTYAADRDLMKDKMRSILRVAIYNKHRKLVLGAFGCGAFGNPNNEVADCWAEVLQEEEFQGRWETLIFAVLDNVPGGGNRTTNFEVFRKRLHGLGI